MRLPELILLALLLSTSGWALPFISDWLSELELSLPSDDSSRSQRSTELRVADKLHQVLRGMAADVTERLPGGMMEDPLPVSDALEQTAAGATFKLHNIVLTGLRDYEVSMVNVDLTRQEYVYELQFPRLAALGQYVLEYYWTAAEGDFTLSMYQVTAKGSGLLDISGNGTVQMNASHSHTEVTYERIQADLGSAPLVDAVTQAVVRVIGPYLFDAMKPNTIQRISQYLERHATLRLRELDEEHMLSGSFALVDSAVLEARRRIRDAGYDPLPLPDISQASSGVEVLLSHGVLTGLGSLKRTTDMTVGLLDQTAKATLALGTERVIGKYRWTVRGFNLLERSGFVKFSVDSVRVRARLAQTMSLRQRPRIDDLDVDLGQFRFRAEGVGSMDYALNVGSQSFPSMIKMILTKAIETPLLWIVESQLDKP